ncbi:hypothetical protein EYF80_022221 [Liparis tanakae]|uniref:Uncharacterized protein n=1 Tax=Liparis tanakae TaxID=230148 RepID=A0A4Z2HP10_9TELE|nr:hypothetical protein EYF80_022221 [Liparis tanakae]
MTLIQGFRLQDVAAQIEKSTRLRERKQPCGDKDGEFRGQKCHRDISHLASLQIRQKCNQQADGQITEQRTGRTLLSGYPVFSDSMFILRSSGRRLRERSGIATRRCARAGGTRWIFLFVQGRKRRVSGRQPSGPAGAVVPGPLGLRSPLSVGLRRCGVASSPGDEEAGDAAGIKQSIWGSDMCSSLRDGCDGICEM